MTLQYMNNSSSSNKQISGEKLKVSLFSFIYDFKFISNNKFYKWVIPFIIVFAVLYLFYWLAFNGACTSNFLLSTRQFTNRTWELRVSMAKTPWQFLALVQQFLVPWFHLPAIYMWTALSICNHLVFRWCHKTRDGILLNRKTDWTDLEIWTTQCL